MGWEIGLVLFHLTGTVTRAFSVPWRGTADQWSTAIMGFLLLVIAGVLFAVWQRHGVAGVRQWIDERYAAQRAYKASATWRRRRLPTLLFWIVVVLLLVFYFNLQQDRGVAQTTRSAVPSSAIR